MRRQKPDPGAKRIYDEVYEIYRGAYDLFGRSQVEWLRGLKRIRNERRQA